MSNIKYAAGPRVLLGSQEKQLLVNKNFFLGQVIAFEHFFLKVSIR